MKKTKLKNSGFSLIEIIVSLFIIMNLTLGIYSLVLLSLKLTADNKFYVEAVEIANQKMEQINNLPYIDIGTVTGSPSGVIPEYEQISREGNYIVHTTVMFYDDPYDGTILLGTDSIFVDYKIATIEVAWEGRFKSNSISIFSKIIPITEETLSGYGLLKLLTVDSNGTPVSNADIFIENSTLGLSVNLTSDSNGLLSYPVQPDIDNFKITVTKPGYGTEKTYPRDLTNTNPSKPDLSVFEGAKTEDSFSIDKLSGLIINTVDNNQAENFKVNKERPSRNQINPRISLGELDNLYYAWEDNTATSSYIYLQKYDSNYAKLWINELQIGTSEDQSSPDMQTDSNGNSLIAWQDNATGDENIHISSIDKNSNPNWTTLINSDGGTKDQSNPQIDITENFGQATSTIIWQDKRNLNWDIYAQLLDNNGNKLWTTDLEITIDTETNHSPTITFDGQDNIIACWVTDNIDGQNIYIQKWNTNGNKLWINPITVTASTTNEHSPKLTHLNEDIYITWTEDGPASKNTYIQKIDLNGNSLWTKLANLEAQSFNQSDPEIASKNNYIYISWTDDRNGNSDIYIQKHSNASSYEWTEDARLNINTGTSEQTNSDIVINSTETIFTTWQDDRDAIYNIYSTKLASPGALNPVANVPLIITGTKQIGDDPIIKKYEEHLETDSNGQLDLLLEWDVPGYTIEINPASSSLNIIQRDPTNPISLFPDEIKNVLIYVD